MHIHWTVRLQSQTCRNLLLIFSLNASNAQHKHLIRFNKNFVFFSVASSIFSVAYLLLFVWHSMQTMLMNMWRCTSIKFCIERCACERTEREKNATHTYTVPSWRTSQFALSDWRTQNFISTAPQTWTICMLTKRFLCIHSGHRILVTISF